MSVTTIRVAEPEEGEKLWIVVTERDPLCHHCGRVHSDVVGWEVAGVWAQGEFELDIANPPPRAKVTMIGFGSSLAEAVLVAKKAAKSWQKRGGDVGESFNFVTSSPVGVLMTRALTRAQRVPMREKK